MKYKKLFLYQKMTSALRKRWFIFRHAKRYLYPELAQQFFLALWYTKDSAQKLLLDSKVTAACLPITVVVGLAQSGKSALLAASQKILPESTHLNSSFQPMMGQSMPQYYLTAHQCYMELPQYFLVNESAQNIPYFEQLMRFWYAEGDYKRIKKIVLTVRLSHILSAEKTLEKKQAEFWSSLALLFAHLPGVEILCVVTEMDRLQGFSAFFSDLSIEERQHVFGFSLSPDLEFLVQFRAHCLALCKRLRQRMWWRCKSENILSRRLLSAEFPKQFDVFCDALCLYLAPLKTILDNNQAVKVKACCFTSALQQGNSFDLLLDEDNQLLISKPVNQSLIVAHHYEYFIRGFFRKFLSTRHFFDQKSKKSTALYRNNFIKKALFGSISFVVAATLSVAGVFLWNLIHLHEVIEKEPVLAYKILATDFASQNLKALIAYESWGLPVWVQNKLVVSPRVNAWVQDGASAYLNQCWQKEVYAFYLQNVAGRAPIVLHAAKEVSVKDFNAVYAPNGLLARFKQNYLHEMGVQKLLQNDQVLSQLYDDVAQLQAILYPAEQNIQLSFVLYATPLPSTIHNINFMLAGKNVLLKNNVLTSSIFNWPNYEKTEDSGYSIQYLHQLPTLRVFTGTWSWLKLFNLLHWHKIDTNNTYLVDSDDGFSVKMSSSVALSALPELFQHLSLPEHI